ncbi:NAD(P)-dependent oxidoreductase [Xylocopilactobacillus apicola]|uniref:3-hydroxyisobutyrate dehydrogenase n=1 Tax=Xylocopilactobacillus apicola TaxID=2932184 RepID=A0AAU9CXM9_9LACO|nr:NAD(P)-dependent oxidoreductase [Xylocopilactobacillus apicola]BDR58754.1 3-hydroxyisobutyrate dehydrogenase [Xylocopilactobacillus apicola]
MKIGFVGTGVMGSKMVINLLNAGYEVNVYNRTKAHAQEVIDHGAKWCDSPKTAALKSDLIITIVGFPKDVREVYFGPTGIFAGAHPGLLAIDMTTSSPKLAIEIAAKAQEFKMSALDAPVSGGDVGAQKETLTIMVGGRKEDFQRALPIFEVLGNSVRLFGHSGQGQKSKMANQIMIAGTMTGMVQSLSYAKKSGLNQADIIEMISQGAAKNWSMSNYGPRILKGDFKPGFSAKHFLKDLRIALESAEELGLEMPATKTARDLYQIMVDDELGDEGTQALIKIYR